MNMQDKMAKWRRDLDALDQCIDHWHENETAIDYDHTSLSPWGCALCYLYNRPHVHYREIGFNPNYHDCDGCPIKETTGQNYCKGTFYDDALEACRYWFDNQNAVSAFRFRAAATKFREWLEELRTNIGNSSPEEVI